MERNREGGKITYNYDAENRLVKKGYIVYSYDKDGNLLTETGDYREAQYEYNGQNRMAYSEVKDRIKNTIAISQYTYDAYGRRTIAQDEGRAAMRTLYDGFTFEVIRESEAFNSGSFSVNGVQQAVTPPSPTLGSGDLRRHRLVTEGYSTWLGDSVPQSSGHSAVPTPEYRYSGISVTLYANGEAVAINRYSTQNFTGGTAYLGKDVLGSVRGVSNEWGQLEERYEYDAFGKPYKGDLTAGMNLGYTGKPYDTATGMYNYGYRDYKPEVARFTTVDPIRDGANWFAYVNNDPINWVDPDGRIANFVIGGILGFATAAATEIAQNMASGQNLLEAAKTAFTSGESLGVILSSTAIGILTSGAATAATKAAIAAGKLTTASVAVKTIAVNTVSGGVDAAAKDVAAKAFHGEAQNAADTLKTALGGASLAAGTSGLVQAGIASKSTLAVNTVVTTPGIHEGGTRIIQPEWANAAGVWGEMVLTTVIDTGVSVYNQLSGNQMGENKCSR